ncbi:DUF1622 domain-containing protein [Hymenobacter sp. DG25A]|uniref:DUF1622 domain-containing protein n=1 Tax=Hymenobacter sp. DG25A TaxID=1385663 RepID=UPI0006BC70D9|nr:DUF1622 domain-containing protein [Hymenobacter sp. DG25A]ALD20706.1 hypothetical protein AM218_05075 [Hymenobacter sp. DG25A]
MLLLEPVTIHTLAEDWIINAVQWLKLSIETIGAFIIGLGILVAGRLFLLALWQRRTANFTSIRLVLARYLALALEFQLGADILTTAIAPSWEQIGKLGAVAVIRTALNFFLSKEMRDERNITDEQHVTRQADNPSEASAEAPAG